MSGWKNIVLAVGFLLVLLVSLWFASRSFKRVDAPESPPMHPVERRDLEEQERPLRPEDSDTLIAEVDTAAHAPGDSVHASSSPAASAVPGTSSTSLVMPVAGISPEQLRDNYLDERSEGRVHAALDIMAPHGTPVLAAADGRIVRLFTSERGGTTIYQQSTDSIYIFYYAHLDRYAEGVHEGQEVRRGTVIAYVGNTGNAGVDNYHLHFAIWRITDQNRYWDGENINPYPLLRGWSSLGDSVVAVTGDTGNRTSGGKQ
jgi:murein DD-endopeptidase MepM/ murein hydrolase activator NlpD